MGEISVVSQLIRNAIAIAMTAALLGTLGDLVFDAKKDASQAIRRGGMSYEKWDRNLQRNRSQTLK